jgi:DNA-binding transcriptional LysR family regulator
MALNLQALRVFAAVVDAGGFSKAAAILRISQPAVSKSVAGLEQDVGMALLDRGAGGIRLTKAGSALHVRAREIFAVERSAEEELRALHGLDGGTLRIGASTTVASYFLAAPLGAFHAAHPKVRVRVASANTREITRLVIQRRVDVALVEGPVADQRIEVVPWREDELAIIASRRHPLADAARKGALSADVIAAQPFIFRERGSGTREVAMAALRERGIVPTVAMVLGSTEAIKQAVRAGLGLAVVSRAAVADQVLTGTLVELPVIAWHVRRALTLLRLHGRAPSIGALSFEAVLGIAPKKS